MHLLTEALAGIAICHRCIKSIDLFGRCIPDLLKSFATDRAGAIRKRFSSPSPSSRPKSPLFGDCPSHQSSYQTSGLTPLPCAQLRVCLSTRWMLKRGEARQSSRRGPRSLRHVEFQQDAVAAEHQMGMRLLSSRSQCSIIGGCTEELTLTYARARTHTHTHTHTHKHTHAHTHTHALAVLLSGLCYAASSGCLTLLNKHALDGFGFRAPNALLCFQCVLTVILVKACEMMGLIKQLQPVKWDLQLLCAAKRGGGDGDGVEEPKQRGDCHWGHCHI
eukprot:scaffold19155_cov19-Tisochrysis_lutea.AAC.1